MGTVPQLIDVRQLGRERVICCWQVGSVLIDPGPASCIENVLAALDGAVPDAVLLTHIHLDHAAATGALARLYPKLKVYVHERGARHMADPERLIASATRLYGDRMELLWGRFEPVPSERIEVLHGGERLRFGDDGFEVAYTPGHAQHHVSYLHDGGTAFTGDVAGVRIAPGTPAFPPTPPPDIDLDAWRDSLALISAWRPDRLGITHFGPIEEPGVHIAELTARLERWAELARAHDREAWLSAVKEELRGATSAADLEAVQQAAPVDQSYAGLRRYWDKRPNPA
jgi:glyoxylase-like metal-dependent hydrolase (beta-lactamase superfamily II)